MCVSKIVRGVGRILGLGGGGGGGSDVPDASAIAAQAGAAGLTALQRVRRKQGFAASLEGQSDEQTGSITRRLLLGA